MVWGDGAGLKKLGVFGGSAIGGKGDGNAIAEET